MKNLILNNWLAKILSLMLAIAVWFLIKKNVEGPAMPKGYLENRPPYLLQPRPSVAPLK